MSNIDKRALRNLATSLDGDDWHAEGNSVYGGAYDVGDNVCYDHIASCESVNGESPHADFIAAANPATVLALLDELESAGRQNGCLREQRDEWERKAISNFEDCSEMAARIEELESQRQMAFMAGNRWADKFREAEKRIAELEASHGNLREAMAGIHNTITGGGAYTPLAGILSASKRAYEESAAAAGKGE